MGVLLRLGRNTIKNYVENRLTDLQYKLIVVRGEKREFEINVYTWLYFIWVTNKDLLYNTENSAQCYVAAWMRGVFRGKWIRVYFSWVLSIFTWNYHNIVNRLCHCLVAKSCLTLLWPHGVYMGSSIHGIYQARILEWGAIPFSRGSSRPRDQTQVFSTGRQILYHLNDLLYNYTIYTIIYNIYNI